MQVNLLMVFFLNQAWLNTGEAIPKSETDVINTRQRLYNHMSWNPTNDQIEALLRILMIENVEQNTKVVITHGEEIIETGMVTYNCFFFLAESVHFRFDTMPIISNSDVHLHHYNRPHHKVHRWKAIAIAN